MWDVLLYMCCFYLLMNKAVLTNDLVEQSQTGNLSVYMYIYIYERVGGAKEMPCSCLSRRTLWNLRNLTGRPQPHDGTKMDRNGLI